MTLSPEALVERRGFLGASECASALGLSPFFTQLQLYQSKLGAGDPIEETVPMMVGQALEPVALALFEREKHMLVLERQRMFVDPKCPWRRCTVDGMAPDGAIVEAKTSGDFRGWGDGEDDIPEHYVYNAHHSLACVPEAPGVHFPVLVGGRTFRTYYVPRETKLVDLVIQGEERFMDLVRKRRPPDPKTQNDVRLLYPKDHGVTRTATADQAKLIATLKTVKAEGKATAERQEALEVALKQVIGDAATLLDVHGAVLATWKSQERAEFVTHASSFRVLRLK